MFQYGPPIQSLHQLFSKVLIFTHVACPESLISLIWLRRPCLNFRSVPIVSTTFSISGLLQAACFVGSGPIPIHCWLRHAALRAWLTWYQGYLRAGKVLQLLGKNDVALGIYQYGIRNVPADSSDARVSAWVPSVEKHRWRHPQLLRGMYDKLARRCSPPTAVDPMHVLPPEIAEMILAHLSFKNIV